MDQNRKIQSSWTVQEKFDIYFSVLFNCYCQNLMSSRDTGHHLQGFRNSSKEWEGGAESEIMVGKIFYLMKETRGDVILGI